MTTLVTMFRRWCREYSRPSTKCARVGHEPCTRDYVGIEDQSKGCSCMADSVRGEITCCRRCYVTLTRNVKTREAMHNFNLSPSQWHLLARDGWCEV